MNGPVALLPQPRRPSSAAEGSPLCLGPQGLAPCHPFGPGSIAVPGNLPRRSHPSDRGRTPQDRGDRRHPHERLGAIDRPGDSRGPGVAVAVDLQECPQVGRGTPVHGARDQPPPGRRTAPRTRRQPPGQPQDERGEEPPGPERSSGPAAPATGPNWEWLMLSGW